MNGKLIFGREPAAWIGIIEAVLTILMAFALGISSTTFGPIMAVVVAGLSLYTAWATKETMLAVVVGFVKAILILATVYGFTLAPEQAGALIALITVVAGLWTRSKTDGPFNVNGLVAA